MHYGVCSILANLPNILTSKIAIIVYIGVILTAIVVLMIMLIVKESDKKNGEYKIIGDINVGAAKVHREGVNSTPDAENDEGNTQRFCMLSEIEQKKESYGHASYDKDITLESLCNDFGTTRQAD